MEIVVLVGIQGSGKTTLVYNEFRGYSHVSLDIVGSRFEEAQQLQAAIDMKQSIVVDNTNTTLKTRCRYINLARHFRVPIRAVYLDCPLDIAIERNSKRSNPVPVDAIVEFYQRLQVPTLAEGFDRVELRKSY